MTSNCWKIAAASSRFTYLLHFDSVLPSEEYTRRRKERQARVVSLESVHIRLGNLRLVVALLFVGVAWAALREHAISAWRLAAPVAAFAGLAVYHSRILRARELAQRAVAFYENGLARIEDHWAESGETGERCDDPHHVYAADLDLFGKGCLFQLLSTARTRMGEDTLAAWLLAPSSVERILQRQDAVRELRDQIDLREELAVLGEDAGVGVHPDALLKWAESANQMKPLWIRWLALSLAGLAVVAAVVWAVWGMAAPFVLVVLIEGILTYSLRKPIDEVLHGTEHAFRDLDLLSSVLARVEAHAVQAPRLQALQRHLLSGGVPASQAIARLRTLVNLIDSRHGVFVRILDAPLPAGDLEEADEAMGGISVLVNNVYAKPSLLVNAAHYNNHWVTFKTEGTRSNRDGIGAKIRAKAGGRTLVDEVRSGSSYISQNDLRVHFGLGLASMINGVEVRWPSGLVEHFDNLTVDAIHVLKEGSGVASTAEQKKP